MGRLFEIGLELDKLFPVSDEEVVDTETGELLDISYLGQLQMEREQIITYLLQEVKNLEADAEAYKKQKDHFAKRQKVAENRKEALKNYIASCLNGSAFEAADKSVKATFRKSESVVIISLDDIRDEYKTREITYKPDKKAIKEAILRGYEVKGAELVTNQNIQIK
ncbi:MAG: siphovirus Gp157 family protein [Pseudobutyrivibrio sp.]|nr:siphovirus Gp157 family protein [Pseudobutyrivibrio sp.]